MRILAHAKINVGLDIVGKRPDGYHELNTIFYELQLADEITVEGCPEPGIRLTCSDPALSCGQDNLAYRAAAMLLEEFLPVKGSDSDRRAGDPADRNLKGIRIPPDDQTPRGVRIPLDKRTPVGVRIHLDKRIPMGAGLGGGSTDAAAVLTAVNRLFGFGLDQDALCERARVLGADVPFFILGGCAKAAGIGEKLIPVKDVSLPPMLLVKPAVSVPTAWAYGAVDAQKSVFHPDIEGLLEALQSGNYAKICDLAGNSFETAVFQAYPQIEKLRDFLLGAGADACVMTGSGSALFAFFRTKEEAQKTKEQLTAVCPSVQSFLE